MISPLKKIRLDRVFYSDSLRGAFLRLRSSYRRRVYVVVGRMK